MNAKVSITVFLLFFAFGASAQQSGINDFHGWQTDYLRDLYKQPNANSNAVNSEPQRNSRSSKRRRNFVASAVWNRGRVLLSDSSTLEGLVSYNIRKDIVQVEAKDTVRIFAANQVWNFEIYKNLPRVSQESIDIKVLKTKYYSLPYEGRNGYARPKLFEVVVNGNTSLLRRWIHGTAYYDRKLYLINPDGKITQIKKRRGSVIKGFDGKHEELKEIARKENLDMYEIRDVMRLVEAYNSLAEQNRQGT